MVNFPTQIPDSDSDSRALFYLFIFSDASICSSMAFPSLGNSDHVVVSLSIDFPSNLPWDALYYRIAYDYSHADWDGLCDPLRDVPREDIFKLSAYAASEFSEWVQVGIDVYTLIKSIRSSLTNLHGFQKSLFCFNQKDKFSESNESSGRLVIAAKEFLNLPNLLC